MPRIRKEKTNLRTKFDKIRQDDQRALGLVRENTRRPLSAANVKVVKECEKWRTEIVKEIFGRVERINDPTLDEFKVRELNDLINKRFREKRMWEERIKELGGPDYSKNKLNDMDLGGAAVPGTKGYKYFGRAKHLDGVKELFEKAASIQEKVKPHELVHRVDADYYGYRDEEDGLLLRYETRLQKLKSESILQQFPDVINDDFELDFIMPPPVPDQSSFEKFLVVKRKEQLQKRFLGVDIDIEEPVTSPKKDE